MADINDLGDIQNSFKHISEALDSMRAQNVMNAGDMDKVLTDINSRLDALSKGEDADFANVFFSELKRSLDERHNFISSRFEEIEGSFKKLVETTGQQAKADELRPIFESISANLNSFADEIMAQRSIIADLNLKIEDLKQDDSTKKEVLKNISVLKLEVERFNNGFESIIVNLNDNFKEVTQTLLKIDSTTLLDSVKKDIENIFLSSNAVLSALQVIDRKNRDLEEVLNHVVTKEDFVLEQNQVANLISQNIQLTDYITKLPTVDAMEDLSQKVDTAVGVINALKNVLNETSDQNQKMLVAQLDNLETKILNISSEDEFVGFKKELSSFAQEIIQSTNLMRADLMNTNSGMKDLLAFFNSLDVGTRFDSLAGLTQFAEENIKVNLNELSEKVSREAEQSKNSITSEVVGNIQNVANKIDSVERNIVDSAKSNFANIVENVHSVLNNIFAMKSELKVDSLEKAENIESKFEELREGLVASKDAIVVNSQQNLESLLEGIQTLSGQLELATDGISNSSGVNVERILSTVTKLSSELLSVKQGLSQDSQSNLERILENFQQLSAELAFSKTAIIDSSKESFDNISLNFDKVSQEISDIQRNIAMDSREDLSSILSRVGQISEELSVAKEELSQTSREGSENILSIVGRFSDEINNLKEVLSIDAQANFDGVSSKIDSIFQEISNVQGNLNQVSRENLSSILASVNRLSGEISSTKEIVAGSSKEKFENIISVIEKFSMGIDGLKENLNTNAVAASEDLRVVAEQFSSDLAAFKGEILVTSKSNTVWIKSMIDSLTQELELVKESLESKSQANFETIISRVEELSTKIEEAQEFTNNNLAEQVSEVKSTISNLPSIIRDNQVVFEDEKRVLIEQNSKTIEELTEKIQNLTKGIISKDNPFKESIIYEFASLSNHLNRVQDELSDKNTQAVENIKTSIQSLEGLVSQYGENSGSLVQNLQEKLTEYLQSIQETTQSNDSKLENSIREVVEIKSEIQSVAENVSALSSDPRLSDLSVAVIKKLEEVLENVSQLENSSSDARQENLQNILSVLESKFEEISTSLEEHKSSSSKDSSEILESLAEKVSEIQDQVRISNSLVAQSVNSRANEIANGFMPIKEAIEKLAEADFDKLAYDMKNQLEESYVSFSSTIKESLAEENSARSEVLEKISFEATERFESLSEKLENFQSQINFKNNDNAVEFKSQLNELSEDLQSLVNLVSENFEKANQDKYSDMVARKEFINGKFVEIETTILENSEKNVRTLENTIKSVLEQFQEANSLSDKFEEAIISTKEDLTEKLEKLENTLIQNQNVCHLSAKEELFEKLDDLEHTLLQCRDVDQSKSKEELTEIIERLEASLILNQNDGQLNIKEQLFERLETLKADLIENQNANKPDSNEELISKLERLENTLVQAQNEGQLVIKEEFLEKIERIEDLIEQNKPIEPIDTSEELFDKLDRLEASLILTQSDAQYNIIEKIQSKLEESSALERENLEEMVLLKTDLLDEIGKSKEESCSLIEGNTEQLISVKETIIDEINNIKKAIKDERRVSVVDSAGEVTSLNNAMFDDIIEEINGAKIESLAFFKEKSEELISSTEGIIDEINNSKTENASLLKENSEELISLKYDILAEIKNVQDALTEDNTEDSAIGIEDFNSLKTEIIEEINSTCSSIQDAGAEKLDYIKTEMEEIVKEINKAQEGIASYKIDIADLLKIKDDEAVSQISSIEEAILEGISQNVEEFKTTVEATAAQIEDKISLSEENYKNSTQALLTEVKSSFYSKVEDNLDDLKAFMEVLENRTDCNAGLDNLKADMFEKISILADDIETAVASVSVKGELQDFAAKFEISVSDLLENLYDKIMLAIEGENATNGVFEKSEEIARRVEDLKRTVSEDVADKLENFGLSIEKQSEDFSNSISEIKFSLGELKENYIDLSLNSSMEISSLLSNVQEKIEDVSDKLDGYDFNSVIESAKSDLLKEISAVKEGFANINTTGNASENFAENFEGINQKLDLLAITSNDDLDSDISEIKDSINSQNKILTDELKALNNLSKLDAVSGEFQVINQKLDLLSAESTDTLESDLAEIKESIKSQSKFIENLKSLEKLDKLSNLDDVSRVQNEIKNIISGFEGKLGTISSQDVEDLDHSTEIKSELKALKKELLESVLNVFDQISFVVEAEDIKEFVEEKSEDVKTEISSKINEKSDWIMCSLGVQAQEIKDFVESKAEEILDSVEANAGSGGGNGERSSAKIEAITDVVVEQAQELKQDIKTSLGNNFNHIISSLDGGFYDIKSEIVDVKQHLQSLQSGSDDSDYTYTFEDIESDITKVRLILNELSQSKQDSNFDQLECAEKLSEDIMSISTRTNKLLLNSEESYSNLKSNLDEFRNIVYKLEDKVRYLDNTDANKRIEKKINSVNNLLLSSVQSDKIFNQAFTYLAEWVDNASETMGSMNEKMAKSSDIRDIKQSILDIKKTMNKKTDVKSLLEDVSDKYEHQQVKLEMLEEKIDRLINKRTISSPKLDIDTIVAEVVAKLSENAVKSETIVATKIDNIEKQINNLSKSIEKLTSYVDAE